MVKTTHERIVTIKDKKIIESKSTKDPKSGLTINIKLPPQKQETIRPPRCGTCHGKGTIFSPLGRKPCPNPKCNGGYIRIS